MKEKLKIRGDWTLTLVDSVTGEILSQDKKQNTIVNVGLETIAKLINGVDSTYFRALAIGTDNTAVTISDVALGNEYDRELATLSYVSAYKAKFTKTFTFNSGVSLSIYEAGVFNSTIETGSNMLARITFPEKAVSSAVNLIVEAEITVARV